MRYITRIFQILLCSAMPTQAGYAQPAEANHAFKPDHAYAGTAHFAVIDPSTKEADVWKRVEFAIGLDFVYMKVFQVVPDLGESLIEVRHSTREESLLIRPQSFQAELTHRFHDTLTDAGERDISPLLIVRNVSRAQDAPELLEVDPAGESVRTYRLTDVTGKTPGFAEVDIHDGMVVGFRSNKRDGKFIQDIRYEQWKKIGGDVEVPTRVLSRLWDPQSDSTITQRVEIQDLRLVEHDEVPDQPQVPAGYTIVDHIRGETRQDGEVLGKIEYGDQGHASEESRRAGALEHTEKWLVWLGVGCIVTAGVVVGSKRSTILNQ